jgi:hypothetical protein
LSSRLEGQLAAAENRKRLFVEESWLGNGGGGWFAAGDAYDAEDGDFGERGAGDEDAVGIGVEVGRGDLDAVVEQREQIVGDYTFEGLAVKEAQAKPKAIEFGAAEKGATLGLEVVVKIADEIDGADADEGQLLMLAVGGEKVDGIELTETRGIEVPAERLAVVKLNDHLFVGAGWGAEFQRRD